MKKPFAIVVTLALALSLAVPALAADHSAAAADTKGSTVQFNVDPTYTITIPPTVELTPQTNDGAVTYEQEAKIVASAGVRLLNGQSIQVTLSAGEGETEFVLTAAENATLPYTVTVGGENIEDGGIVATFGTSLDEQESILHFAADDPTYAGEYTDSVTFTISIVPPASTGSGDAAEP